MFNTLSDGTLDIVGDIVEVGSEKTQIQVHSVAGLVKLFFRDLPTPIFDAQAYNSLIDVASK